jgi:hypothetical protein
MPLLHPLPAASGKAVMLWLQSISDPPAFVSDYAEYESRRPSGQDFI